MTRVKLIFFNFEIIFLSVLNFNNGYQYFDSQKVGQNTEMQSQIRLHLQEQSDLGQHCLKRMMCHTICVRKFRVGMFRTSYLLPIVKCSEFMEL